MTGVQTCALPISQLLDRGEEGCELEGAGALEAQRRGDWWGRYSRSGRLGCLQRGLPRWMLGRFGDGVELGDVAELLVALFEQLIERLGFDHGEVVLQAVVDHGHGAGGVGVGAAFGLAEDVVDAAEVLYAEGGVLERCGRLLQIGRASCRERVYGLV